MSSPSRAATRTKSSGAFCGLKHAIMPTSGASSGTAELAADLAGFARRRLVLGGVDGLGEHDGGLAPPQQSEPFGNATVGLGRRDRRRA